VVEGTSSSEIVTVFTESVSGIYILALVELLMQFPCVEHGNQMLKLSSGMKVFPTFVVFTAMSLDHHSLHNYIFASAYKKYRY
jgi:hypothetical protein